MSENLELLEHIYKDSEMSVYTLSDLLDKLKDKDNKIKNAATDILHKYEEFLKKSRDVLESHNVSLSHTSMMAKMGADMGIKKEVKEDNSDASIADMLIKGISMGSLDMEKKLKDYKEEADKDSVCIAKSFLKFQEDSISKLKKYL